MFTILDRFECKVEDSAGKVEISKSYFAKL